MAHTGLITLTTDFGTCDGYAAVMKGVILGILPAARLIDYTHEIEPQQISQAAYLLQTGYRFFPEHTVHLVVVDPGVGTARRALALQTPEAIFVAPDNGVLSLVWHEALERWGREALTLVELAERRFQRSDVSATFHGRDIFAPAAAHLAAGTPIREFGPLIDAPLLIDTLLPVELRPGELRAQIIHVDRFGNCITNVTSEGLKRAGITGAVQVLILDQKIDGLCRTYADAPVGSPLALIGSSGHLELAVRMGNAAQMLGVGMGDRLRVMGI